MADVVRYWWKYKSSNIEIFQREVGKTLRYMYIPTNLITRTDAEKICEIITNGGNIANSCVVDVINGGATYYFTWKVIESLKRAEAKVYDEVVDFLRSSKASAPTISASNTSTQSQKVVVNSFLYKVDDNFEDPLTGKVWKIVGINVPYDAYEIQKDNATNTLNINRNVLEQEVSNGRLQLIFVNQPVQNISAITNKQFKDKILEELQKVEDGDVVKTIRKDDGKVWNEILVKSTNKGATFWAINGIDRGIAASLYNDYWEEVLKKGDLEVQIIKKGQSQKFKVGDKVKIRKDSGFYGDGARNPKDKIGEITEIDLKDGVDLPIRVTWADGAKNTYNEDDLELYQGLSASLKVVCILNEKQGLIEDLAGQVSSTNGLPVWNIFFNDGTELLCYREEFFVEGDVLQLESANYSPKILVNKISIGTNKVFYYLIEKSSGNVGINLEENTIPDLFTFSIKLVDGVYIQGLNSGTQIPQTKPKIYAVGLEYQKQIVEVVKLVEKDEADHTHSIWELYSNNGVSKGVFDQQRYLFFTTGDVIQVIDKKLKLSVDWKIINIILYNNTIEYEVDGKLYNVSVDRLFSNNYVSLKQAYNLEEETQPQAKPIVYAVDLEWKKIMEVTNDVQKMTSPKDDFWVLYDKSENESYTQNRREFFIEGDIVKFTYRKDKTVVVNARINKINFIDGSIDWLNVDDNLAGSFYINGLIESYKIEIVEFYNLRELFDQPILVPKDDSGATPLTPTSTILSEIEQAKKDLGQLLFMRNLLSPIDFEQKIEVTQLIAEKQKLINELNFRGIEEKMATDKFFDDLFEQSFTDIKHEYQDIYNNGEEIDFFTPNGKRSELSFELNEIIRTPQFKEWFGDWELSYLYKDADALELDCSKVLTLNFEPRVVWHGTGQQFSYFIFDKFPAAYFAVNKEYSQFFADLQGGGDGYVIPFFLNIRNPLDLTHFGTNQVSSKDFFDYVYLMTGLTMEQLDVNPIFLTGSTPALQTWMYIRNNPKMLKKIVDTRLYDGIHFYETNPNVSDVNASAHKTEAYVIFSADQCKIAEPNRGMLLFASLKSFLLKKGGKI
jgi:hypothetical protein